MSDDSDSALRSVTRGAGLVMFGTVLQLGIAFVAKALMARFLELDQYGFVSLGIIAINFGATISLLGLDTGVARYLTRFEDSDTKRRAVYFSYALTLLVSALLAIVLYISADSVSAKIFQDSRLAPVLRVMAFGIPLWTVMDLGVGVTRGTSETAPRIYTKNIVLPLGRVILVGVAIALGAGALGVAGAYVGSYMFASILMTYIVLRRFRPTTPRFSSSEKEVFTFSIPLTFSNLSSLLYRNIDLVLLGIFWGAGQVAVYNVVYPLARLLLVGTGAFGFLLVPVVSSLEADDKLDDAKRVYQVTTKWLLLLVTPPFAVMVLFPEMAIKVPFGAKYTDGALTLIILTVGFFLTNVTGLNRGVLTSVGYSRTIMITDVTAMLMNVILNLLLIPTYGFLGAGVATTITYLGRDFVNGIVLYRWTNIHPFTSSMVRPALFTALAVTVIYVPVRLFFQVTLIRLIGLFLLFLTIYGVSVLRFGGIEREDVMIFDAVEAESGMNLEPVRALLNKLMA